VNAHGGTLRRAQAHRDRAGNSNTASEQIQCWSFGTQAFRFGQ
jgi:hypothetical protein